MAKSSSLLFSAFFFFFFLLFAMAFVIDISHAGGEGSLTKEQCPKACDFRCSATHHRGNCIDLCNKCCEKCLCVPSGTYGHKEECPCYNNWKTKEGTPKCP
ncbi:gibberellin-regulated protein 12 [Ricinus communis]|nr:gibberellin-regulated protein 12 [Ricinus communis]